MTLARAGAVVAMAITGLVAAGGGAGAQGAPSPPAGDGPPVLVSGSAAGTTGRSGRALRQRPVEIDLGALPDRGPAEARLELFEDVSLDVAVAPSPSGADGWTAWSGSVEGEAASSVTIATDGATTSALVTVPGATYRVRTDADGDQIVQLVRPTGGEGHDDVSAPTSPATGDLAAPGAAGDAAPGGTAVEGDLPSWHVIDVLVAYTPQAVTAAGNLSNLNAEAAMAVTVSNTAFTNSGVNGRFRLAGTYAVPENLDCDDLQAFASNGDGVADGVHTRRTQLGADVVTVLSGAGCGIGYRPLDVGSIGGLPFSIVGYAWAVDNLTFPHELGHNLGMHHDRFVAGTDAVIQPYAYGFVNVGAGWRTIMAYNDKCSAASTFCTRLTYFSNPDVSYGGAPMGRPQGTSDAADARKVLNQTFPRMAEVRSTPAPFTSWTRFVEQQARDLQFGATVPAATASNLSLRLASGELKPAAHVETTMRGAFAAAHAPVTRLYQAYFERLPDKDGLDYWVGKYRSGMTISSMSSKFAASAEFIETYGPLGNQAFVERIYENVLGRAGEPDGVTYWTGVLNRGEKTRGQVMVGFSESGENKTKLAPLVDVVMIYRGLLARMPTSSEVTTVVGRFGAGTTRGRVILELMATTPYANRVVK